MPYRGNTDQDPFTFGATSAYRFSGYETCSFETLDQNLAYLGNMPAKVEIDRVIPTDDMFVNPASSGGRVIRYDPANPD